ncbi:MAG: hypothetical protein VX237_06805 [Chloroflexota bacterium]|nr:hypothetical protein [Chloroflexota bacterium]
MNSTININNRLKRLRRHRAITIAFIVVALAAIVNFSLIQETNNIVVTAAVALLATSTYNYRTISQKLSKHEDMNTSQ